MKKGISIIFAAGFLVLGNQILYAQNLDLNSITQPEQEQPTKQKQVEVGSQKPSQLKNMRNLIKEGNELYNEMRYNEALINYNKALEINPSNEVALFNMASALLRTSGNSDPNDSNSPINQATGIFNSLTQNAQTPVIAEKAFYNLGNIAYNKEDYASSIEHYKNVLRRNPSNEKARQNLRLAQLKKQQQDQQNQDQQQQDQQQQDQQQQDQQQQQQNQDKQEQQQNQDQQQQQQQNQNQQQQQQPQMSDANAERILKAMENQEAATRQKVEAQKAKEQNSGRRRSLKPW